MRGCAARPGPVFCGAHGRLAARGFVGASALTAARSSARSEKTEHVIHNEKGQIQEKNSYGNDPVPPRDKK